MRNIVKHFFCKMKDMRRLATRFEKYATRFLAMLHIFPIRCWINRVHTLGCSEELTFIFYNVPSFLSGAHICLVIRTLRMNNGAV